MDFIHKSSAVTTYNHIFSNRVGYVWQGWEGPEKSLLQWCVFYFSGLPSLCKFIVALHEKDRICSLDRASLRYLSKLLFLSIPFPEISLSVRRLASQRICFSASSRCGWLSTTNLRTQSRTQFLPNVVEMVLLHIVASGGIWRHDGDEVFFVELLGF